MKYLKELQEKTNNDAQNRLKHLLMNQLTNLKIHN